MYKENCCIKVKYCATEILKHIEKNKKVNEKDKDKIIQELSIIIEKILFNIGRQKDDELKIVMRSIYFQYSKNLPNNIKEQVLDLNTRVIDWCVPEIISNIKQTQRYIRDISTMPVPLERSVLPSGKGLKNLDVTKI